MKNKRAIYTFVVCIMMFLSLKNSYSQSGWFYQNPTPELTADYYATSFVNSNTGWAVGVSIVSKTTDGGVTWIKQLENNPYGLQCVYFLNDQTGYAAGGEKFILTTNGGTTWIEREVPGATSIVSVYFKNATTGFAGVLWGKIYKTTNAGLNWQIQEIFGNGGFMNFQFFSENDGIAFSSPTGISFSSSYDAKIYRTTNSGVNWIYTANGPRNYGRAVSFINMNTGWICVGDSIYKTINGGVNWTAQYKAVGQQSTQYLNSINFANAKTGYACGWYGGLYKTSNGGNNWYKQNISSEWELYSVSCTDGNSIYAVGEAGNIFRTSNGGSNWFSHLQFQSRDFMFDIQGINSSTVFAIGSYYRTRFFNSTNGGVHWDTMPTPLNTNSPSFITFLNDRTGWIGYGYNALVKTTNAGISWENKYLPELENIDVRDLQFIDSQTGWAISSRYIFRTTNGGNNWTDVANSQLIDSYTKCFFVNAQTGWVVAKTFGYILKTTNSGNSWIKQDSNCISNAVHFINENTGWVGADYYLKKTTNGGIIWDSIYTSSYFNPKEMWFANESTGWYIDMGPNIYKTTTGGASWTGKYLSGYLIYGMSFLNANTGWLCGENGAILKTTSGGNVFISQTSTELPLKYSLYQNYPNPFNPSTTIKFDIHKSDMASLKVFDLLGKEVETLVDEQLSIGTYEVTFNAASLSSGIYFYVLKTGDFVESKRMVLVK